MLNKITVAFVLIGFLATCTPESTNLNRGAMPSSSPTPSSSPNQLASPIPSAPTSPLETSVVPTATSTPSPSATSLAPERCDKKGELTAPNEIRLQTIQTRPNFTQQEVNKPRFLCHHPQNDTLFITNTTEVLEFNPRSLELKTIIDTQVTGFQHIGKPDFAFNRLKQCAVSKEGILYLHDSKIEEVYSVDLRQKTIQNLQYVPYGKAIATSKFSYLTDFTLTNEGEVLISDRDYLHRIKGVNTTLLFRTQRAVPIYKGLFPQKISAKYPFTIDADFTLINAIATDHKGNIYITNSHQKAFLKLTSDGWVFLVDPKGIKTFEDEERSTYRLGTINNILFSDKYNVFFGKYDDFSTDAFVITRDGCVGQLDIKSDKNEGVILTDFASTNDGTLYAIDSKNLQLVRLEVPPDLPEKAQWEPPQAWKNATGMD